MKLDLLQPFNPHPEGHSGTPVELTACDAVPQATKTLRCVADGLWCHHMARLTVPNSALPSAGMHYGQRSMQKMPRSSSFATMQICS